MAGNEMISTVALDMVPVVPAADNPAAVYLSGLAAGSRPTQRCALARIAALFGFQLADMPWHTLRAKHCAFIRSLLSEQFAASTANRMLSALRGVLRVSWQLGYLADDEYRRMEVKPIASTADDLDTGRYITPPELSRLLAVCDDGTLAGVRDKAMISIGYLMLLRRHEICGLTLDDFDVDGSLLHVRGKGNKTRTLPVTGNVTDALAAWLAVRGNGEGPLFCSISKTGKLSGRRLSEKSLHMNFARRCEAASLAFGLHDLRRTGISDLLHAGADLAMVARLAGHASARTTLRYDRRPLSARRVAIELLRLPA